MPKEQRRQCGVMGSSVTQRRDPWQSLVKKQQQCSSFVLPVRMSSNWLLSGNNTLEGWGSTACHFGLVVFDIRFLFLAQNWVNAAN